MALLCYNLRKTGHQEGSEVTHGEHVTSWGAVDRDAAVQKQEAADGGKSVSGGRVVLQTLKLVEIPGKPAVVHLHR